MNESQSGYQYGSAYVMHRLRDPKYADRARIPPFRGTLGYKLSNFIGSEGG
jgi:hypothetical protein